MLGEGYKRKMEKWRAGGLARCAIGEVEKKMRQWAEESMSR